MTDVASSEGLQKFTYRKPNGVGATTVVGLGQSDVLTMEVHVAPVGSTLAFEADGARESTWLVLGGQARFTDAGGAALGDFGHWQGVHAPRASAYQLEAIGDADLEVLHIAATDPRGASAASTQSAAILPISYDDPDFDAGSDITVPRLWPGDDMLTVTVEKVRDGEGDDPPHAHFGIVGAWFMLGGRVRFHGMTDASAYEMNTEDAVFLPSGTAYGFKALDHEPAHVLHVKALDLGADKHERVDY